VNLSLVHPVRILAVVCGVTFTLAAWAFSVGNQFTLLGVLAWAGSIVTWVAALSDVNDYQHVFTVLRGWRPRLNGWTVAWVAVLVFGAVFRFADLNALPPELTRDQAENIDDARRILAGITPVYFPNNTGREPVQMYAGALLAELRGTMPDFLTFKLLSAFESWLALPLVGWLGIALLGPERRMLGRRLGLFTAALLAISFWSNTISRQGLRIALMPAAATLVVACLSRALRSGRRMDYLLTGLVLGGSLYTYQAARVLPLVVLVGVMLDLFLKTKRRRILSNAGAMGVVAFAVFTPLFGYAVERPDVFWNRLAGRVTGEELTSPQATDAARWLALEHNLSQFGQNIINLAGMFHLRGDLAWVNNVPRHPALDPAAGVLFLVGLGSWLVYTLRHPRNPLVWLFLAALLLLLLPSALALANTIENPSFSRTGGALPLVYVLAAFPVALLAEAPARRIWVSAVFAALVAASGLYNANLYFNTYRAAVIESQTPYTLAAKRFQGYWPGNTFIVADPTIFNPLAFAIASNKPDWPNSFRPSDNLMLLLADAATRDGSYRLDASQPLLFLYLAHDSATDSYLRQLFPSGEILPPASEYEASKFTLFRVPSGEFKSGGPSSWMRSSP
jgi:hypothetical protein